MATRSSQDVAELEQAARTLGLRFEPGPFALSPALRPNAPLFSGQYTSENGFTGEVEGVEAAMFDLTSVIRTAESETVTQWTVIAVAEPNLPGFVCLPRGFQSWMVRGQITPIWFDRSAVDPFTGGTIRAFERRYTLGLWKQAPARFEKTIRDRFRAPVLEAIAERPGWSIQSADRRLILAARGCACPQDRPELWQEALAIRAALIAPVATTSEPIPPPPGMDVARQRNRRVPRIAGGIAGAIIGFFTAFISMSSIMFYQFGRMPAHGPHSLRPYLPLLLVLSTPVVVLIGAFAGVWIGGLVADLRFRPGTTDDVPAPIARRSAFAGVVLGWFVGGATGLGLATQLRAGIPRWLIPLVMFGPAALGLLAGGFAGLAFARKPRASKPS